MCGITGIIGGRETGEALARSIARMKATIAHRGPDGEGSFFDTQAARPVGLGHQRLAIIDPADGAQPMRLDDAGLTLVFNGAIYNHLELRQALVAKGHAFRTHSDTEVILHAYREWGTDCLAQFNGMFAFALWDAKQSRLFCARDRVGIKPFYYRFDGEQFTFASEIKAILAASSAPAEMDGAGFADYVAFQFTTGEKTLFRDIKRLEPGHCLVLDVAPRGLSLRTEPYWRADYTADETLDEAAAVEQLRFLVEDAVRLQLRADVPVGAHLSGGVDSSALVGIARALIGDAPLMTFTGLNTDAPEYDETPYAHEVARICHTEQHDILITGADFATLVPELMYLSDEPTAGPGIYPQYFVSKYAAKHVKVCLGGQGGDELFVGYARYLVALLEHTLRRAVKGEGDGDVTLAELVPHLQQLRDYGPMLRKQWERGLFGPDEARYFALVERADGARFLKPDALPRGYNPFDTFCGIFEDSGSDSYINRMQHFDLKASLPALLHLEDRVSMGVSLESRVPLLDHRIVEFMAKVPPKVKAAHGELKGLFRRAMHRHVPQRILSRTDKNGFLMPIDPWLKGPAREFVADTLLGQRTRERGLFRMDEVEAAIMGEGRFSRVIWGLLCFELWQREFIDGACRQRITQAA